MIQYKSCTSFNGEHWWRFDIVSNMVAERAARLPFKAYRYQEGLLYGLDEHLTFDDARELKKALGTFYRAHG